MMDSDMAELGIIASDCKHAIAGEPDLEQRIKKAMAVVRESHWLFPGQHNADKRFRGALAAVMLAPETTDEDKAKITSSLIQLRSLSALLQGMPMDTAAMLREQEANPSLPLMAWWYGKDTPT
jgi:hypothetical protein